MESVFKQRIGFNGDLKEISKDICRDFNLGDFVDCKIILTGYEDFNFSLETNNGKFFVKIFSNERTIDDCKRNVDVIVKSLEVGVFAPKLYKSKQGYLHLLYIDQSTLRICVMDFIDGKDFFTSKAAITHEDMLSLVCQASLINSINIEPAKIYDSWAITNFLLEFEKKSQYLEKEDSDIIKPLVEKFKNIKIASLPHCFAHGDIIRTNVIRDKNDKIWIVDFSVSNYYPRIQELAVLACDILFNRDNKEESEQNLKDALEEYQKTIKLTTREIEVLPTYIKLAHAMHVLCATYEKKAKKNDSKENEYFLNIGKSGLRQIN
ncbi:MAG: phosphotransferase [Nanoarchaeota archaeon]|nr:phosphotransferase [Nanoarchaeota archaeon]MBU1269162.1 phosphotransferase [Nanoarchaeota archaeon]MBU1603987.1 phosphotransferase [Nanoarchaeota archaeon]MBU2443872.1 phosphotransferase [Nanoarchaeota archaeon]